MVESAPLVSYPDVDSRVEALRRDGYVYFPGVLNADEIAELRAAMDRLEARKESFDRDSTDGGYHEKHIKCVFNHDAHFLQFPGPAGSLRGRPGYADQPRGPAGHRVPRHRHDGLGDRPRTPDRTARRLAAIPAPGGRGVRPARPGPGAGRHRPLLPRRPVRGARAPPSSSRAATAPEAPGGRHRVERTGRAVSDVQGRRTWSCSGARCGTGARRTAAGRPGTWLQVHYANRMIAQKFPPYLNRFQFDPEILARADASTEALLGDHAPAAYD